jgi:hypothetical protein
VRAQLAQRFAAPRAAPSAAGSASGPGAFYNPRASTRRASAENASNTWQYYRQQQQGDPFSGPFSRYNTNDDPAPPKHLGCAAPAAAAAPALTAPCPSLPPCSAYFSIFVGIALALGVFLSPPKRDPFIALARVPGTGKPGPEVSARRGLRRAMVGAAGMRFTHSPPRRTLTRVTCTIKRMAPWTRARLQRGWRSKSTRRKKRNGSCC